MKIKLAYLFIVLFLWNGKNEDRILFEPHRVLGERIATLSRR